MSIKRAERRPQYTILDNGIMNDTSLSFGAIGLLAYILSKPDNWVIKTAEIMKRGGIGRRVYNGLMGELKDAGYATLERTRGQKSGLAGSSWVISEYRIPRESQNVTVTNRDPIVSTDALPKTETSVNLPSLRSGATGHDTATAAALPPKRKATRNPKPLFDAFKAAYPKATSGLAGQFDSECSKVGLTIEDWHAFMASTKAKQDYLDGFLTMGNALNRFNAWAVAVGRRSNPASRDDTPDGAPANWRDIVYTHDGTRRYPALALPRLGLEPYAPPSEWPTWYQQFEGVNG